MPIPILAVLSILAFVSAMSIRILDPMIPAIAREFGTSPERAAYLATAFALPFALGQLPVGALGDALGKARILKFAVAGLTVSLFLAAAAPTFELLFAARVFGGLTSGGIIPLCFAMVGDRFAPELRQVALSRVLMAMLSSAFVGSIGAGLVADAFGWRMALVIAGLIGFAAFTIALLSLPARKVELRPPFSVKSAIATYAGVFRNPLWKVCFPAVFAEGVVVFGLMPYVAALLEARNMGGTREAGFVAAGLGIGGIGYTLLVPFLLAKLGPAGIVRLGGIVALFGYAAVPLAPSWPLQMLAFGAAGLGFYMVHNTLQLLATELAPQSRGSATAMHAFWFFLGHATGPLFYRAAFDWIGTGPAIMLAGAVMLLISLRVASVLPVRKTAPA
jgi:predicted MFS family arabinose efflux permease